MLTTIAFVDIASFLDRITDNLGRSIFALLPLAALFGWRLGEQLVRRTRPQHEEGIVFFAVSVFGSLMVGWFMWGLWNLWSSNPKPLVYAPVDLDLHLLFRGLKIFLLAVPVIVFFSVWAYTRQREQEMHKKIGRKRRILVRVFWLGLAMFATIMLMLLIQELFWYLEDQRVGPFTRGGSSTGNIPPVTVPPVTLSPGVLPGTE